MSSSDGLSVLELTAPTWLDHGSIQGTLLCQLAAEVLMRERWEQSGLARSGETFRELVWEMLFQIINHATQHRSQVALALTQLGASPGFLDYLAYVGERDAG